MKGKAFSRIYLDNCALCRPYDDQSQIRIRLETAAVFLILEALMRGDYGLVSSPVHLLEIGASEDPQEKADVAELLQKFGKPARISDIKKARLKAEQLWEKGLGVADAAHLVFAMASADCLISCDDRFVKRGRGVCPEFPILGPVEFCDKEKLR